ncbi:MAG: hypothetical protein AAFR47_21090 [Pseudomonadota bacterium]
MNAHTIATALDLDEEMVWMALADADGVIHPPKARRDDPNEGPTRLETSLSPEIDTIEEAVRRIDQRGHDGRWRVCQMRAIVRILWAAQLIQGSDCASYPRKGGYHPDEYLDDGRPNDLWLWAEQASRSLSLWTWFYLLLRELTVTHPRRLSALTRYAHWFGHRPAQQLPLRVFALRHRQTVSLPAYPLTTGTRGALWRLSQAVEAALAAGVSHARINYLLAEKRPTMRPTPFERALQDARRFADEADVAIAVGRVLGARTRRSA